MMAEPPAGEAGFREQFTRFAEEIRHLVNAVFGGDVDVSVTDADHRSQIVADVPLTVEGQNLARLKIDLWCCLDSHQQYLAVEESTYQLVAQVDRAPIFRFEYERAARSKPAAHVQIHAHRGALSHLLSQARHLTPHSMESLHLPVGGDRFRPCLEDVIEFLVVECRFDSTAGWRAAVQAGREQWRRTQTRTVVRDSPGEAAAALRALGYTVEAPGSAADPQDDVVRMRRW